MNQVTSNTPLIEFHGLVHNDVMNLKRELSAQLKSIFSETDYNNLVFTEYPTVVEDVNKKSRPFIRMFSSEYILIHELIKILKRLNWLGEVEHIKINQYFDLRK